MSKKEELIKNLKEAGIDPLKVIEESFLGYKYRKREKKLSISDNDTPTHLITIYYGLSAKEISFDKMKKAFITHYINNESKLEGINDESIHGKNEIQGLKVMYEYIHSDDIEYMFDVFTLKDLHKKLLSTAEYPEYAGDFRNFDVYLPGTGTELSGWRMIFPRLRELDEEVQELRKISKLVKEHQKSEELLKYLDRCVELKCKLIKVHPFADGNGRTIRGFINKLLEDAGLPPIYIKSTERTEYHNAMNKANNEGDYTDIKNFYRYKICDSIVELDINQRTKSPSESIKGKK